MEDGHPCEGLATRHDPGLKPWLTRCIRRAGRTPCERMDRPRPQRLMSAPESVDRGPQLRQIIALSVTWALLSCRDEASLRMHGVRWGIVLQAGSARWTPTASAPADSAPTGGLALRENGSSVRQLPLSPPP